MSGGAQGPEGGPSYEVWASDPFHLTGAPEKYRVGRFASCADAVAACERLVDDFLASRYREGMTREEMLAEYYSEGTEPYIVSLDPGCSFSARRHAEARAASLCDREPP